MVFDRETYSNITLYMMQYLGICDEDRKPLWKSPNLTFGNTARRPLHEGDEGYEKSMESCTIEGMTIERGDALLIPVSAPQPVPVIAPQPIRHLTFPPSLLYFENILEILMTVVFFFLASVALMSVVSVSNGSLSVFVP
jgi:hypothetical protein